MMGTPDELNMRVGHAVEGSAACALSWKLESGENVCNAGLRPGRNG